MPSITFDRFEFGLDTRKGRASSDANRLRALTNAYITTGRQIKKRPALVPHTILSAGTVGLFVGKGLLQTFYGGTGSISHGDPLIAATRVTHPGTAGLAVSKVHFCDVYDGFLYVIAEYEDGSVWHHWINSPSGWAATTAYSLGDYVSPVSAGPNGFIYECTTAGTSGGAEPSPWPTTPGGTYVDGTVTWTCRTYAILDANNPRSRSAAKLSDRIFAIGDEIVAYHALGNPRDWTTASDAGFLPVGLSATGAVDPSAIGVFDKQLAVVFQDAMQLWAINPDPEQMALSQVIANVGTTYSKALLPVGQDLFLLTPSGFRSVGIVTDTGNYQDADVGNPIDSLVQDELSPSDNPSAVWYNAGGQAWWVFGSHAWVYTFSRTGKISAWSRYEFPFEIEYATTYNGELYLRSGDAVYVLRKDQYEDPGGPPRVRVELPYMNLKSPGSLKMITGFDCVMEGSAQVSFKYDPNDESRETLPITLSGDTASGTMQPVELCCTSIAPVFTHEANERFELHSMTIYYENLGPV